MKDIELKLISELMKNSRRSDRELAKQLRVSQPTVTRLRSKLEKEGIIKEYTMIPDFAKIGYEIMGITSLNVNVDPHAGLNEMRKATIEAEKNNPHAGLTIVNCIGSKKNRVFIDFYRDYAAYTNVVKQVKRFPYADVESIETMMVDLKDEANFRILSMSAIANHLLSMHKDITEAQP